MPEAYQQTLSDELTRLLTEVLEEWGGCWPRLAYVTDAGYHPTQYFDDVLSQQEHPRHPGRLMSWIRIVDFYHACEYLTKLSQVLFDDPRVNVTYKIAPSEYTSAVSRTWVRRPARP